MDYRKAFFPLLFLSFHHFFLISMESTSSSESDSLAENNSFIDYKNKLLAKKIVVGSRGTAILGEFSEDGYKDLIEKNYFISGLHSLCALFGISRQEQKNYFSFTSTLFCDELIRLATKLHVRSAIENHLGYCQKCSSKHDFLIENPLFCFRFIISCCVCRQLITATNSTKTWQNILKLNSYKAHAACKKSDNSLDPEAVVEISVVDFAQEIGSPVHSYRRKGKKLKDKVRVKKKKAKNNPLFADNNSKSTDEIERNNTEEDKDFFAQLFSRQEKESLVHDEDDNNRPSGHIQGRSVDRFITNLLKDDSE